MLTPCEGASSVLINLRIISISPLKNVTSEALGSLNEGESENLLALAKGSSLWRVGDEEEVNENQNQL